MKKPNVLVMTVVALAPFAAGRSLAAPPAGEQPKKDKGGMMDMKGMDGMDKHMQGCSGQVEQAIAAEEAGKHDETSKHLGEAKKHTVACAKMMQKAGSMAVKKHMDDAGAAIDRALKAQKAAKHDETKTHMAEAKKHIAMCMDEMGKTGEAGGAMASAQWTCPMHPEVKQDKPGECPVCHMKLVPAKGAKK